MKHIDLTNEECLQIYTTLVAYQTYFLRLAMPSVEQLMNRFWVLLNEEDEEV